MTEHATMCQMIQCMKAMKQAVEDDVAYANNPKKRKDRTASWLNASYHFSRIMEMDENSYSPDQMRNLYKMALN